MGWSPATWSADVAVRGSSAQSLKRVPIGAPASGPKRVTSCPIAAMTIASRPSFLRCSAGIPTNPKRAALPEAVVASWISASGPTMLCAVPDSPASRQNGLS